MISNGHVPLTQLQLEIVMHLCNGMTLDEIAKQMNYSPTNVKRHLARAKQKTEAKTTTHLASIVIASGMLIWNDDGEREAAKAGLSAARNSA